MLVRLLMLILMLNLSSLSVHYAEASPAVFTFQGQIVKPNGKTLDASLVTFNLEILSPAPNNCVLYEEQHTINMRGSNGVFALHVGEGTQMGSDFEDTNTLVKALSNTTGMVTPARCEVGTTYTPALYDGRQLRVSFNDGLGYITLQKNHRIASSPYSISASKLDGMGVHDFIKVNESGSYVLSQSNIEWIFENNARFSELQALINGTSNNYLRETPPGDFSMNSNRITNVGTPSDNSDATNKAYADSTIGGNVASIGTMTAGNAGEVIVWNGSQFVSAPPAEDSTKLPLAGGTMTGDIDMNNQNITGAFDMDASNNISAVNDVNVGNNLTVTGTISSNGISSRGSLALFNGANYMGFQTPVGASDLIWTLPNSDGTNEQILSTDGSGNLGWVTPTPPDNLGNHVATQDLMLQNNSLRNLASGSIGTPAISFNADTDTGIYQDGADTFAIATAGVSRLLIDSAGKVGIGTTTLTNEVNVNGTIDATFFSGDGSSLTNVNATSVSSNTVGSSQVIDGSLTVADLGANSVGTTELINSSVTSVKVADNSLTAADLGPGSVDNSEIANDAVTSNKVADNSLTANDLAPSSVGNSELAINSVDSTKVVNDSLTANDLAPNSVGNSEIASNAVNSIKVIDNSLTANDLAPNSVGSSELAANSVDSTKIVDNSLTASDLAPASITNSKLANNSVNSAKVADNTLTASDLAAGSVTNSELANNSVNSIKVADNTLTASDLAAGSVTNSELANNSVNSIKVADNSLTASDLAAGSVGNSELASNAVNSTNVIDNSLTANDLAANSVGASEIASDAVGSAELASNSVGSAEVIDNSLTANDLAANSVGASELANSAVDTPSIQTGAVTSIKILNGTINTADIANGAITNAKISGVAVDKITNGSSKFFQYRPNNVACAQNQILKWNDTSKRWVCTDTKACRDYSWSTGFELPSGSNRYMVNNDPASITQRCRELGYKIGSIVEVFTGSEWCTFGNARTKQYDPQAKTWNTVGCQSNASVERAVCCL